MLCDMYKLEFEIKDSGNYIILWIPEITTANFAKYATHLGK